MSPAIGSVDIGSAGAAMSLLNARLGVWLPSPRYVEELRAAVASDQQGASLPGPVPSPEGAFPLWVRTRRFKYLLRELTGRYDPDDRFLYVTDGGQFDNLGVYALLERRCSTIIAFDASGDLRPSPPRTPPSLDAFNRTCELASLHLGITITPASGRSEFDFAELDPGAQQNSPRLNRSVPTAHTSVATYDVFYPAVKNGDHEFLEEKRGILVLAKAVLNPNSPKCLRTYVAEQGWRFPADSTLDQFLEPDRFEKYGCLGKHNAEEALTRAALDASIDLTDTATAIDHDPLPPSVVEWGCHLPDRGR